MSPLFYITVVSWYSKPSLSHQHWDNSKTGSLAKLAAWTNFQGDYSDIKIKKTLTSSPMHAVTLILGQHGVPDIG